MTRSLAALLLWSGAAALARSGANSGAPFEIFRHENVLGTSLELKIAAPSPAVAKRAEQAAIQEIDRLARILSAWDANSEIQPLERHPRNGGTGVGRVV